MKRLVVLFFTTLLYGEDLNIINNCKELEVTKYVYKLHDTYDHKKVWGLQYGLKNRSDKELKLEIFVYPKDKQGHHIGESSLSPSTLKPYFEYPYSDGTYYAVGEDMTTFSGDADLVISCKAKAPKTKGKEIGSIDFVIPKETVERIKKATGAKSEFDIRLQIGAMIEFLIKSGGLEGLVRKVQECKK